MNTALPISVAMATFNGATYLPPQLASLAQQTVRPFELVITDDGSTDETEEVVQAFAATAPFPVRWHRNAERLGYRANFMRAASLCSGQVIAFCDQDDVWYPDKLGRVTEAFAKPEVLLFHHEARVVRDGAVISGSVQKVSRTDRLVGPLQSAPWQFPFGFTQAIHSRLRDYDAFWWRSVDFKGNGEREAHDQWYFFLASALGSIAFHPEPLADYRQHESNTFGAGSTHRSRLDHLLENRTEMYRRLARAAKVRSHILYMAGASVVDDGDLMQLLVATRAWEQLAHNYQQRVALYERGVVERAKALGELLMSKAYSKSGFWNFGQKALVKDAVLGFGLAPLVRRYGLSAFGDDWSCAAGSGVTR